MAVELDNLTRGLPCYMLQNLIFQINSVCFDAQGGSIEWKLLAVSPKVLQWITALTFPLHTPFFCRREYGIHARHILFEETETEKRKKKMNIRGNHKPCRGARCNVACAACAVGEGSGVRAPRKRRAPRPWGGGVHGARAL